MRNMSVWGPGTNAVLRRREFDIYNFPVTRAEVEESNDILVDANKVGYKAVVSTARPSARAKKAAQRTRTGLGTSIKPSVKL